MEFNLSSHESALKVIGSKQYWYGRTAALTETVESLTKAVDGLVQRNKVHLKNYHNEFKRNLAKSIPRIDYKAFQAPSVVWSLELYGQPDDTIYYSVWSRHGERLPIQHTVSLVWLELDRLRMTVSLTHAEAGTIYYTNDPNAVEIDRVCSLRPGGSNTGGKYTFTLPD